MPYAAALLLTIALEAPVYLTLLTPRPGWARAAAVVVLVNLATHPLVWLALTHAGDLYWALFAPVEVGAVVVEAALVRWTWPNGARPLVVPVAVLANGISCLVGLVLNA